MSEWFQSQVAEFYDTGYKGWSHRVTNVLIPDVNMLKNSSTFAVSVTIDLSIKFVSVCVNGSGKRTLWTCCVKDGTEESDEF